METLAQNRGDWGNVTTKSQRGNLDWLLGQKEVLRGKKPGEIPREAWSSGNGDAPGSVSSFGREHPCDARRWQQGELGEGRMGSLCAMVVISLYI